MFIIHSQWEWKLKTCHKRPDLTSGYFIKVFDKTTTCPRQSLLSCPRVAVLYRFDCISFSISCGPGNPNNFFKHLILLLRSFSKLILWTVLCHRTPWTTLHFEMYAGSNHSVAITNRLMIQYAGKVTSTTKW